MRYPEEELIYILKDSGVDFTLSLPCEKIKSLLEMIEEKFFHVPLTREEEGVGISAGAALAGRWPAMFVQSSGIGNMINALLSLTGFYKFPLAIFVSQRGIYKEKIAAQAPVGKHLPGILKGAGISYSCIGSEGDFRLIKKNLKDVFMKDKIHAFLLSPKIWENSGCKMQDTGYKKQDKRPTSCILHHALAPKFTRYEVLRIAAPYLKGKVVVCNLGIPAKEIFEMLHQRSNFYMLGSMGMATPIGLGISLSTYKEVVVIDGDGSLLMNPGTLATAAYFSPDNLTILAIDNNAYGSTGNQPTLTGSCVDLEMAARGFGIKDTIKASTKAELVRAMKKKKTGIKFIHALAVPGNKDVPNITLDHLENKKQVMKFISKRG